MSDSGIQDVSIYSSKVMYVINDYMRLDLNDEEAINHFESVIDQTADSVMPDIYEQIHKVAQFFREF